MLIQRWFFSKMYRVLHHSMMALSLNYYSGRLPKWGTMHNGDISELRTLAHPIEESVGFAWRTPMANDSKKGANCTNIPRNGLQAQMNYPTPGATDGNRGASIDPDLFGESETGALYRTSKNTGTRFGMNLTQYVAMDAGKNYPTPTTDDSPIHGGFKSDYVQRRLKIGKQVNLAMTTTTGKLNPDWVELLMGYPIGWTDINSHHPETYPNMDLSHHELPIESNTDAIE
jgi:DNA (cytosine-5)-methyltransferase 1